MYKEIEKRFKMLFNSDYRFTESDFQDFSIDLKLDKQMEIEYENDIDRAIDILRMMIETKIDKSQRRRLRLQILFGIDLIVIIIFKLRQQSQDAQIAQKQREKKYYLRMIQYLLDLMVKKAFIRYDFYERILLSNNKDDINMIYQFILDFLRSVDSSNYREYLRELTETVKVQMIFQEGKSSTQLKKTSIYKQIT